MPRTLITDIAALDRELPSWYGQDFAADVETSGLDYTRDRLLGLALTFADGRSYYVAVAHTVPEERIVTRTAVERSVAGSEEYEHVTPSGRRVTKTRPVFAETETARQVTETVYPTVGFVAQDDLVTRLRPLFSQRDRVVVFHNAKFDLHVLTRAGIDVRARVADTLLAAQLVNENWESKSLKELCALVGMKLVKYSELAAYPGFGREEILGVPLKDAADYAMHDTEATWALWQRFRLDLAEEGVESAFRDVWMPLVPVLQQMEARGIALDLDRVREARAVYEAQMRQHELAVWQEGTWMLLGRLEGREDEWWEAVGEGFVQPAAKVLPEPLPEGATEVTVNGMTLPVLRKANKTYQPRVPWFNVGSAPHLRELLYGEHGLKPPDDLKLTVNKSTGEVGVDRTTLVTIRHALGDDAPKVLDHVLAYRKAAKMISTYFDVYEQRADERDNWCLRTNFNQAVTDTGRLSSSSPNLQNQPSRGEEGKLVRSLFVARPGHKLVVADYGMMELRVAAHYSRDETMLRAFEEGLDLHALTASAQSGIPYDDLLARIAAGDVAAKTARQIGKTSNFGLLYGMGAGKFRTYLLVENGVRVTMEEAQALIDGFDSTFAGVTAWKDDVVRWAHRLGYVQSFLKRKRRLPELRSRDRWEVARAERQAVNYIVQGGCADIMVYVMPRIQQALAAVGGSILLSVHDEIVAEVPDSGAATAARLVSTLMADLPTETFGLRCPLVAEAGVGDNWGDAKH